MTQIALVHDIVEIDTSDVLVYDLAGHEVVSLDGGKSGTVTVRATADTVASLVS